MHIASKFQSNKQKQAEGSFKDQVKRHGFA